jgi:hypothetical protein
MSSPLHLDVFVVPYEPIAGLIPPMSKGEPTWSATSVSLISGERDAVLIDAALTPEDAFSAASSHEPASTRQPLRLDAYAR